MDIAGRVFILWQIFAVAVASDNGGFLFTAPKTFLAGYDENVCITFRHPNEAMVKVAVLEQKKDNEIASSLEEISVADNGSKCFKVSIPRTEIKKGRLQLTIQLKTEEDFKINYIEQISIQTNPDVSFIQTDKPVYNSGHIVRFRIFALRSDLTPVFQPVERIWIENPNGIHLVQWLNESASRGFINKTFQLSDEPLPGKWHIKVKRVDDEVVSQSFLVKNYVLPKFFVTIKSPGFMDSSTTNVTVCAKYTFDQPVHGNVIIKYFIKCSFSYYCQEGSSTVSKKLRLGDDGCADYEITLRSTTTFAQGLIVNATVMEDGTGIKAKSSIKIEIRNLKKKKVPEFSASTRSRKFKPGLPFRGQVIYKDVPNVNERVLVCLDVNDAKSCKDMLMMNSVAEFLILPVPIRDKKSFKAYLEVKSLKEESKENAILKLNLVPWYSPSSSYLQLENLSNEPLQCGQKARINVMYSISDSSPIQFHYMVKARGDILTKGTLDQFSAYSRHFDIRRGVNLINRGDLRRVMQFQFYVDVAFMMSPRSYLMVYYIRSDGEVVADTLKLKVKKCLPNKVKTKWEKNLAPPKSNNNFFIETSSQSICALTITDKSTKLVLNSEDFTTEKILEETEKYEVKAHIPESNGNRCKNILDQKIVISTDEMQALLAPHESDSRFVDSLQAFNDFGALVITDLDLETRPCRENKEEFSGNATTRNSNINAYGAEIENISIFDAEDTEDFKEESRREAPLAYEMRSFFPETWIWDLIHVDDSGTANLNFEIPHTLTEWTAETVCLSSVNGLGVSESAKLITYQPFFLDFAVPHSLKRKEVFHLEVSVFNYEPNSLPIKISLGPLESFISKSEESRSYCIKSKSKVVHRFVLEPTKVGEAQITVKGEIDFEFLGDCDNAVSGKSDTVIKKTTIKHEGFPSQDVRSGFICGNTSNFNHQVSWNLKVPPDVVESSVSVKVLVSGDILGPSLKNIDRLITLPTGCGEQNMIVLVPNVLLLDYLLLTKHEDLETVEKALKNLDLGYQRQLNYKHSDGSYSAFGEQDDKGSIWLTTFVVRYLSQAKKYIYIDEKDLNTSVAWIMKHQLENGCFPMIGRVYHRKLQEKLMEEDASKTLTAYILISLIEAGISKESSVVKNAIYCLKPNEETLGVYGDLLSAYALILAGEHRESRALMMELLKEAKRSYGMLWWEYDDSIESAIEMTGYGILSLVKLGGPLFMAAASDAVRWIIQFQNQNGGFVSSQDTVLGLEAISKFSSTLPRTNEHDELLVNILAMQDKYTFNISESNRLIQQKMNLPSYTTNVNFDSVGRGCALVQTLMKYNTRRAKPNDNFRIQLRIQSVSEVDMYSIAKFHICVRHKTSRNKINMAVLEVPMVSGYYPDRTSLYDIPISKKGVRRWEEYEDKVNFYFEELKTRKICVEFLVVQEVCIENAAPALIRMYDYYNTMHQTTVKYSLMRECQNGSWLGEFSNKIKQESKRDLSYEEIPIPAYHENNFNEDIFQGFVDFDQDLETPKNGGDVMPVYALPPPKQEQSQNCPHCLEVVPNIFQKLYCSSQIAVKVLILSAESFEFQMDLSHHSNFTSLSRTVFFTKKEECDCSILNSINSFALLLVTPPRSFRVQYVQEIHIDDSIQLYPWGNTNEMPQYLIDAMNYCQKWPLNSDY